ncbi:hypothetical protein LJR235_001080 [Pararhizobium sp. LjRoot235]|uniref:DUF7674 family protein n=1 Tax=Pararhizobium sp. LjRoot235 TaxID=3342291 RepID=UPI003ECF6679
MEITIFIEKMKNLLPDTYRIEEELVKEFYPSPPGINSLCSSIGWAIAENFESIEDIHGVFDLIESGMRDGDHDLKDAIATGLIEAIISQTDHHPGTWEKIVPHLGPLSAAYAIDWIKFTETGQM